MPPLALTNLLLAVSVAALPAQTILIVDAAGGTGANFTDLPAAVMAAPDGAVLRVRPGSYSPFSFSNKGLSIVGETPTGVRIGPSPVPMQIGPTSASQPILLANLEFTVFLSSLQVSVQNANGVVVFDRVAVVPSFAPGAVFVDLQQCANVQFHRCALDDVLGTTISLVGPLPPRIAAVDSSLEVSLSRIQGLTPQMVQAGIGPPGTPAISLLRSRCVAVASDLIGGVGALGCMQLGACLSTSGDGGVGVDLQQNSTLLALATRVTGGPGRDPFGMVGASSGGDGAHIGSSSVARLRGFAPAGGAPGQGAVPGVPYVFGSGGSIDVDTAATPAAAEIQGTMARGQTLQFTLTARPSSLGAALLAYDPTLLPLEPFVLGSLLAQYVLSLGPIVVPSTGVAQMPLSLGANWPLGQTYYGQFVTLDPVGLQIWTANAFALHVNH